MSYSTSSTDITSKPEGFPASDEKPSLQSTSETEAQMQMFKSLADHSQEFIGICDLTLKPFYLNAAGRRLVGLGPLEEACAVKVQDFFFPEDQRYILEEFFPRVLREGAGEVEIRFRHFQTGAALWMIYNVFQVKDTAGQACGYATVSRDITQRKMVEEELQVLVNRYELVLRGAGAGIWDWDVQTNRVMYSPRWKAMRGYGEDELSDSVNEWKERIHPEDEARVAQALEAHMQGLTPNFEQEYRTRRRDGSWLWIMDRGVASRDAAGHVVRMAGSGTDITRRKAAEAALQASERLYRAIGETINYGIWVCDPNGQNTYASESFLKLVGITQRECSQFGWKDVLHPEEAEKTIAAWRECVRLGGTWYREHRFRGVDGQWHPILACGVPVRGEQGEIVCWAGINLDISQLKQAQDDLRKAKDELLETNNSLERLVAERTAELQEMVNELEHFSYTITHDMRSPLRAMMGFAQVLIKSPEELAEQREKLLRRICTAAQRMDKLITDALSYSRAVRQELPIAPVELSSLLRGMLDTYPEFQACKGCIHLEGQLPTVLGNEAALTQCFSNLLGNAVKFVVPGNPPEIRVWAKGEVRGAEDKAPRGRVFVWVEDKGVGIPKSMQPRLFEMFYRGNDPQAGTGIGLALVRKAVERMGGRVGVESEPGKGSRFWVELERADE